MKKTILLAICLLSFTCLNAQTFTSGHLSVTVIDTIYHDSTACSVSAAVNYMITLDSSYTGDSVNIVDPSSATLMGASPYINTTGVSPWTFTTTGLIASSWDDYNSLGGLPGYVHLWCGNYKVTSGPDTVYVTPNDSFFVTNPCSYDTVQGHTYIDNNSNCIFDAGDVGFYAPYASPPAYPVLSENLSSPTGSFSSIFPTLSATDGWYLYMVQKSWMVNYTITLPPYLAFIFPMSPCFAGPYAFTTLPQSGVDFPLQCSSSVDVQCNALSPGTVRLHSPLYMQPYVSNTGCDAASGELTLVLDSRVIYDPSLSTYPADTVRGDTLIWNYSGLSNLTAGAYWNAFLSDIYLSLDTTVTVGDTLCFSGYTNIPAADVNPLNNAFAFCIPVVYSYDPNLKVVSPQGAGPQGYIPDGPDTLTYTLHFQNTGSGVANNINIIDTLDSHINASSLNILGTSFNMSPQWLAPGIVEFSFNNINLPDSGDNFAASQGAVQFSVVLNTGLAPGTQVKNTGYIYFDANPPVVTNTVLNTLDSVLLKTNTVPMVKNIITVYPNPAINQLTIESSYSTINQITISNLLGQTVYSNQYNSTQVQVDVSILPSGVYFIKVNGTEVRKFVKE